MFIVTYYNIKQWFYALSISNHYTENIYMYKLIIILKRLVIRKILFSVSWKQCIPQYVFCSLHLWRVSHIITDSMIPLTWEEMSTSGILKGNFMLRCFMLWKNITIIQISLHLNVLYLERNFVLLLQNYIKN